MRVRCELGRLPDGSYQATCADPPVSARGATEDDAVKRLESEIRYYFDYCPCTSATNTDCIEIEVVVAGR